MKVVLYGNLAEAAGREVELDLAPDAAIGDAFRALGAQFPQAAATLARGGVRGCIDDHIVADDAIIPENATLALLPPLSGG